MRKNPNWIFTGIAVILSVLFLIGGMGCGLENGRTTEENATVSFPENYMAEDYPLPQDFLAVSAAAVKEGSFYFSVIKDASGNRTYDADTSKLTGELRYIDFSQEAVVPVTVPYSVKENDRIIHISPSNDGTLTLVIQNHSEIKESGEPVIAEMLVKKISLSGEELLSYSIMKDVKGQETIYLSDFTTDDSGNVYAIIQDTALYIWNAAGQLRCTMKVPGSLSHISQSREGNVCLIWLGIDGFQAAYVNAETGTLEQGRTLSQGTVYLDMAAGINSDLLLASSEGIYEYDMEQGEEKRIISFSRLDIPAGFGGRLLPLLNDRIAWFQAENNKNTLTVVRGAGKEEVSWKKTLVLGGTFHSVRPWHHQAVAKFNKTSPKVRIEIKTYGSEENEGIDELNMAIVNGQGPDIIVLPRQFSMEIYARKEVLTDLYPYIDGDGDMERSDFQENVLQAYETEGKLYGIPVNYWITTMAAPESAAGDIHQWNLDEMIAFADRYMPGSTVFSAANKSHVLDLCLMANGDSLINWSENGQGFNRELFIKMLMFADRFVPDDAYVYDDRLLQRIQDTEQIQIMCHQNVLDFAGQQIYLEAFGEPVSYPGYPSENGNGNLIDSNFVMAVNSACGDKEAAWQFIDSLLSEEFQWYLASAFGFPIRKSVLEQKIESEIKPSYKVDENGIKIEEKQESRAFGADKIDIYSARKEDVQAVLAIIDSADKIRDWNGQIDGIIYEEAKAFFDGDKTIEEAADIVERRVGIYISEMK